MALKIMSIFGTRPEASKMLPVVDVLKRYDDMESTVLVTAQHREMLDQVLETFCFQPDFDLNMMEAGQTLTSITQKALLGIGEVLQREKPDLILVHGDTTTTFSAALAAFYAGIACGHVEAGLRTYDKYQPYPEEMNRLLTTALADLYFAPTEAAKQNLIRENIAPDKIFVTGNTAIDSLRYSLKDGYAFETAELNALDFNRPTIVLTAHRRENLGEPLRCICRAVAKLAHTYPNIQFVYAVHLNPLVQQTAQELLSGMENVYLTAPLPMSDMHNLLARCTLVLTDSGGLQEEAPAFGKPVVVLRNVTERPEGLGKTLVLAGTDEQTIFDEVTSLLTDAARYDAMASAKNPFGDGEASERIVQAIRFHFGLSQTRPEDYIV